MVELVCYRKTERWPFVKDEFLPNQGDMIESLRKRSGQMKTKLLSSIGVAPRLRVGRRARLLVVYRTNSRTAPIVSVVCQRPCRLTPQGNPRNEKNTDEHPETTQKIGSACCVSTTGQSGHGHILLWSRSLPCFHSWGITPEQLIGRRRRCERCVSFNHRGVYITRSTAIRALIFAYPNCL
ncbi:unnamed protein product [Victoria cruziana]